MRANSIDIEQVLHDIENGGGKVIKGFRSLDDLTDELSNALAAGHAVVFAPTNAGLRHFYDTSGFISTVSRLVSHLGDVEILVPPGLYGQRHVFAVAPKCMKVRNLPLPTSPASSG